ncbi:MFS transporter small subunit [Actinoalloteichus hymeniacidonis]|uniref:Uncharacterized protein n=1 Tax=Actinoalloteichus hymeniacidonis TaxID=340345 RepID=A0AAC9MXY4_9PSEU|nr:hypothetical protein [Actinoalloteichus hymeniacidonis]AOS62432.1 hypothetical protein TL08_08085 [Actinoalloteichus hymeniacidonis]MBB5909537.1 hypothetical protein [Actinoalloteichus hymeniacidonis]
MNAEQPPTETSASGGRRALMVVAWLWVSLPFGYGLAQLIGTVAGLFTS